MPKIQDYAIIGNGRSAALISRDGSLDWLCWPRFDSPSLFAGILDQQNGGSWKIAPLSFKNIERRYIEDTNVLHTQFYTDSGILTLIDFMAAFSEEEKEKSLQPEQEIIRRVKCEEGEVELFIHFDPRPNYGRERPYLEDANLLGLRLSIGRVLITLRSTIKLELKEKGAWSQTRLKAGQTIDFSLAFTAEGPAILPPLGDLVSHKLDSTVKWWQGWSSQITYKGPYKKEVTRSALALKLLGYAPSGTFVAAPTTSLPERIGGDLNWDYRFSWLRDAAFTVRALFGLGYQEEAEAFVSWLLHSTRLTRPELRVLYDVYGRYIDDDIILPQLQGYAHSYPVRIGNGVRRFFELDVYGEVIESVTHFIRRGGDLDHETQQMLIQFGNYICQNWQKPDTGIWEKMIPLRHYTHSRLMCWVALDRLLEMHEKGKIKHLPVDEIKKQHQLIRKAIEEKSWNVNLQSYVKSLEEEELDAALLVMPLYGFDQASSLRMQQTFKRIEERLIPAPGLVYRYEKSVQEGEGAFGLCCFWRAEFLAKGGGHLEEAHQAFRQILGYANDLGLFSEEIDPKTGDALGNFPQAFTHVGLINAALSLIEREEQERKRG